MSCWMMKIVSRFPDSRTPIGPFGLDSCVVTVIKCFPGFGDSRFNAELLKILLISQSRGSVWPQLKNRSRHAFHLLRVISSSVFCHGFLFHRLAVIFHSHLSRSSCCVMKCVPASLKSLSETKNMAHFHGALQC